MYPFLWGKWLQPPPVSETSTRGPKRVLVTRDPCLDFHPPGLIDLCFGGWSCVSAMEAQRAKSASVFSQMFCLTWRSAVYPSRPIVCCFIHLRLDLGVFVSYHVDMGIHEQNTKTFGFGDLVGVMPPKDKHHMMGQDLICL